MWGVPEENSAGDELNTLPHGLLQTDLTTNGGFFLVGAVGKTDSIQLGVISGDLVNANPGHPPQFYFQTIAGLQLSIFIGSQITRKFLRHRS